MECGLLQRKRKGFSLVFFSLFPGNLFDVLTENMPQKKVWDIFGMQGISRRLLTLIPRHCLSLIDCWKTRKAFCGRSASRWQPHSTKQGNSHIATNIPRLFSVDHFGRKMSLDVPVGCMKWLQSGITVIRKTFLPLFEPFRWTIKRLSLHSILLFQCTTDEYNELDHPSSTAASKTKCFKPLKTSLNLFQLLTPINLIASLLLHDLYLLWLFGAFQQQCQ